MSVHFKFKNFLQHDFITFDTFYISVGELRKAILEKKKIGKGSDFFLQITNAQTKEVYDDDKALIPKNTSVLVARIPVEGGLKKNRTKQDLPFSINDDNSRISYDKISKSADLLSAKMSEEDKVKAMINQSGFEYDPSKYKKVCKAAGLPPPSYRCNRCGNGGHFINNCPTNNPNVKRSTGIPRSFMIQVDGPEHKGALLTSSGNYAVPIVDHLAYQSVKKEKPPFVPQEEPIVEPAPKVSEEYLCMICKEILQDAVTAPCCGDSFCDECIRQALIDSDEHECPVCHKIDVSPNDLVPNLRLRKAVLNFKNKYSYFGRKRSTLAVPKQSIQPHCSPDSTVEICSQKDSTLVPSQDEAEDQGKSSVSDISDAKERQLIRIKIPSAADIAKRTLTQKLTVRKDSQDIAQPSTSLTDKPAINVSQEKFESSKREDNCSEKTRNNIEKHDKKEYLEVQPIRPIETVNNLLSKYGTRQIPLLHQYSKELNYRGNRDTRYYEDDKSHRHSSRWQVSDRRSRKSHYSSHERPSRSSRYHSRDDSYCKDKPLHKHRHSRESPNYSSTAHVSAASYSFIYPPPTTLSPYSATVPPLHALPSGAFSANTTHIMAQPLPPGVDSLSVEDLPYMSSSLQPLFSKHDQKHDRDHISHRRRSFSHRKPLSHSHSSPETSLSPSSSLSTTSSLNSLFSSQSTSASSSNSRSPSCEKIKSSSKLSSSQRGETRSRSQRHFNKYRSRSRSYSYSRSRSHTRSQSRNRRKSRFASTERRSRYNQKQKCFLKNRSRSRSNSYSRYPSHNGRKPRSTSRTNKRYPQKRCFSKNHSRSTSYSSGDRYSTSRDVTSHEKQGVLSPKRKGVSENRTHSKSCKHKCKKPSIQHRDKKSKTQEITLHFSKTEEPHENPKDESSKYKDPRCSPHSEIAINRNKSRDHSQEHHSGYREDPMILKKERKHKFEELTTSRDTSTEGLNGESGKRRTHSVSSSESRSEQEILQPTEETPKIKSKEQHHERKKEDCIEQRDTAHQKHGKEDKYSFATEKKCSESNANGDSSSEKNPRDLTKLSFKNASDFLDFEPDYEAFSDEKGNVEKKCKHQKKHKKHKQQKMKSIIIKNE